MDSPSQRSVMGHPRYELPFIPKHPEKAGKRRNPCSRRGQDYNPNPTTKQDREQQRRNTFTLSREGQSNLEQCENPPPHGDCGKVANIAVRKPFSPIRERESNSDGCENLSTREGKREVTNSHVRKTNPPSGGRQSNHERSENPITRKGNGQVTQDSHV